MQSEIDAASIVSFHERQLLQRDWPVLSHAPVRDAPWPSIDANHRYNGLLWQERERACRLDLPPAEIAACRGLAGRYDRKREEARMAIDRALSGAGRAPAAAPPGVSAGAMIDGLSTLALRIRDVRLQARCVDAGAEHAQACAARLEGLLAQRRALAARLDALLAAAGSRWECREEDAVSEARLDAIHPSCRETWPTYG